jgi:hypothetical protein
VLGEEGGPRDEYGLLTGATLRRFVRNLDRLYRYVCRNVAGLSADFSNNTGSGAPHAADDELWIRPGDRCDKDAGDCFGQCGPRRAYLGTLGAGPCGSTSTDNSKARAKLREDASLGGQSGA